MTGEAKGPVSWNYQEEYPRPVQVEGHFRHDLLRVDFGSIYVTEVVGKVGFFDVGYLTRNPEIDAPWMHALGFRVDKSTGSNPARFPGSLFAVGDKLHIPSLERSFKAIEKATGKSPALLPVRVPYEGRDYLTYDEQAGALLNGRLAAKNEGTNTVHDQVVHVPSLMIPVEFWTETQDTLRALAEMSEAGHWPAAQESFEGYMMLQDAVSAYAPSLVDPPIFRSRGAKIALSRVIAGGERIRAGDMHGAKELLTKDEWVVPLSPQGQELFDHTAVSVQRTIQTLEEAA